MWNEKTCACAAEGGHLEILQWAREKGCEWDKWTCTGAAQGGHLEVLQWARKNGCVWGQKDCQKQAALMGHTKVVAWIDAQPE